MNHEQCEYWPCVDCRRQACRVLAKVGEHGQHYETLKYQFYPELVEDRLMEPVGHIHFIVGKRCIICPFTLR